MRTREDFVAFVRALETDLRERRETWTNADLPSFLDGMAAWCEDSDGYYERVGQRPTELPPWRALAEALAAARVYE